jgi:endonuclease YncB( thermonuclease family)
MWRRDLIRIVPLCFLAGASIELFMIHTGFYHIVTQKEGERRAERALLEAQRKERLKRLGIEPNPRN